MQARDGKTVEYLRDCNACGCPTSQNKHTAYEQTDRDGKVVSKNCIYCHKKM